MKRKLTAKERIMGIKIIIYVMLSFFPNKKIRRKSAGKVIDLINCLEGEDEKK